MNNNDLNNLQSNTNSTYEINNANQAQANPSVMKSQPNPNTEIKAKSVINKLNKGDTTEKAKYVLKTNEAVRVTVQKKFGLAIYKRCIWAIVVIIILFSFLFGDNLFAELSGTGRFLLIWLVITALFTHDKKGYVLSPLELHFYDDHLILYRPRIPWTKYGSMLIERINYSDPIRGELQTKSERIHIYGSGRSIRYDYRKDGSLPDKPARDKEFKDGLTFFNISLTKNVDFVKEIEEHSPIKIKILDC